MRIIEELEVFGKKIFRSMKCIPDPWDACGDDTPAVGLDVITALVMLFMAAVIFMIGRW